MSKPKISRRVEECDCEFCQRTTKHIIESRKGEVVDGLQITRRVAKCVKCGAIFHDKNSVLAQTK